ncbi:MAG TPA: DUF1566 domain-containing protein [Polyangiales bacterium]
MTHRCYLLVGLFWSLALAFPALADAPPGRYTVSTTTGTVYDTRTKLTWQQTVDANSYTQANAKTYCTNLAPVGTGWRLPNVRELLTIVDPTKYNPSIDPTAFPSTPVDYFWSSSNYVGPSGGAWYVNFVDGSSGTDVTTSSYRVWCVH